MSGRGSGGSGRTDKQSLIIVEPVHFAVFIVTTISALVATQDHSRKTDEQTNNDRWITHLSAYLDLLGPEADLFQRAFPPAQGQLHS